MTKKDRKTEDKIKNKMKKKKTTNAGKSENPQS